MKFEIKDLDLNLETEHSALFAQSISRMRFLKTEQLKEIHRIVSDMWTTNKEQRQNNIKQETESLYR